MKKSLKQVIKDQDAALFQLELAYVDLVYANIRAEREIADLHLERQAERALVFDLLDHLQAVVVRCP